MQYYSKSNNIVHQSLPTFATPENCRDYGYWPIYDAPFNYDLRYYSRNEGKVIFDEESQTYMQTWEPFLLPLDNVRYWKKQEFSTAFAHLEARAARPTSTLALRMADGEAAFPEDDFDAGLLWSIEQIKQANRDLLAQIEAMTIPDTATLEEAQAIIAEAVAIMPWLPGEYGETSGGVA